MIRRIRLSIKRRLYLIIGTMAVLLAIELVTLRFAMRTLSAVRAFVAGEGSWSKAQKNAALAMERYASTHDESDYREFLTFLEVPEGDHRARMELLKRHGNPTVIRDGFLAGQIHPDDIQPMVDLLRRFSWVSYLSLAIEQWALADGLLVKFKANGVEWHRMLGAPGVTSEELQAQRAGFQRLNEQLTVVEDEFSRVLGAGSRWLDTVVVFLLVLAVLAVETIGLTLTLVTTRALSHGLRGIQSAATDIGRGDFSTRLPVTSDDEIGALAESINQMGALLEQSYAELERRVQERTAELEKLARDNVRLYEEAASAVKMREEFFSIASHELRTPLTALHLQHRLLQKTVQSAALAGPQAEKLAQQVRACVRQTTRLAGLSSNLLDLTKVRLGKLELNREPCDLAAVAQEAVAQLEEDATRAGSVIAFHSTGPLLGEFDQTRMTQVATNLLSNAIKYGEGRPIDVTVGAVVEAKTARLTVRDHGHGIAVEDQARIFEQFERVGQDVRIPGLGLGLYVARQIVLAHNGELSVRSVPDEGTTFTVDVPIELQTS